MNKGVLIIITLSLSLFANASQEGVLSFSDFAIKSQGIGNSGVVEISGTKNESGRFSSIIVNAFGKKHQFPENVLSQIPSTNQNGLQLSYESGYPSLGGKTLYIQFQKGFITGLQTVFIISLNEESRFKIIKHLNK